MSAKDEFISYDLAKELQKFYNVKWSGEYYYNEQEILCRDNTNSAPVGSIVAPTLSSVQRWLREEEGIIVSVWAKRDDNYGVKYAADIMSEEFETVTMEDDYDSYEEALQYTLSKAIDILKGDVEVYSTRKEEEEPKKEEEPLVYEMEKCTMTCCACPSQWDAYTKDGHYVYIRYRWGGLTVHLDFGSENSRLIFTKAVGGPYDGDMSTDEMMQHTEEILDWTKCK